MNPYNPNVEIAPGYVVEIVKLQAENERLRAALQRIADEAMGMDTHSITEWAVEALSGQQRIGK